jgi:hypothetical protein
MAKLTGSYNEYGYVVRKNGRTIYAAGNSPYGSQTYIGSKLVCNGSLVSLEAIPEGSDVLDIKTISRYCENTITEMHDYPHLWGLKLKKGNEYEIGSVEFAKDLNPLAAAYQCGALTR